MPLTADQMLALMETFEKNNPGKCKCKCGRECGEVVVVGRLVEYGDHRAVRVGAEGVLVWA